MSRMVPPKRQHEPSTSLIKDAIQIDHDSNLFFVCFPEGFKPDAHQSPAGAYYCGTDEFVYRHFFADFGPLHLGHIHLFCSRLGRMLELQQQEQGAGKKSGAVYVYSSDHPHRRSNAAVLVLAFAVLCLRKPVEEAYAPFFGLQPPLIPYRDASFGICTYHLEVLDCARALARAASLGHFNLDTFNAEQYAFYDKIEHGDLNWIIPGKFVAFSGPLASRREVEPGKWTLLAEDYLPIFRKLGVTCVIRFNKRCYDRRRLTEGGIKHVDLFYEDGGNPSEDILQRFLKICENTKGAIAVHCKAGLGRTGTNIALYMMKHYGYTAAESIALCRICRPGSIVGPQQQFLHNLEQRMKTEGEQYRRRHRGDGGRRADDVRSAGGGPSSRGRHPNRNRERHLRQHSQPYARMNSGQGVGDDARGHTPSPAGRRPTTSPLLLRRHSTVYSGGGGGGGGAAGGRAGRPTEANRQAIGNRWAAVGREGRMAIDGDSRGLRGISGSSSRGRGRGRGAVGSSALQRPRRGSSPLARTNNAVEGEGEGFGDLMEALRLSSVKGAAEGGGVTDRVALASTARGKLVPLATSPARPSTSTTAARRGRKLPTAAVLRSEEQTRGMAYNPSLTTSPLLSDKPPATAGNANNRSSMRAAARSVAAPGKASLAWQNPVERNKRGSAERNGVGRAGRNGPGHHAMGGPWAANESPYSGAGAQEYG